MIEQADLVEGARNLLVNCAGLKSGDRLLIVHEQPDLGWYDLDAPMAVDAQARRMGMMPSLLEVGAPTNERDPEVSRLVEAHDNCIFFARLGDQDRFAQVHAGKTRVVCYARTAAMLASDFGRTDHRAFVDLKTAVTDVLSGADRIEIRCPLGTDLAGNSPVDGATGQANGSGDVSVLRFPMGMPMPMDASGLSGRVAVARYLTPTGSRVYQPASLRIGSTVFAEIASGRIAGFAGDDDCVADVRSHYDRIACLFGIDGSIVHSWHAGIHPACAYDSTVSEDPDRWANTVFANPRFLHFHTCGDYAPGEICWMVLDHTVMVDGKALWDGGRLCLEAFSQLSQCLEAWPVLKPLFDTPTEMVGVPGWSKSRSY